MRKTLLSLLMLTGPFLSFSQIGGNSTYAFLNLATPARIAAMGGTFISVKDADLNLGLRNPSLLDPSVSGQLALNGVNYFSDIKLGNVSYAQHFNKLGTFAAGINYINYGDFIAADEIGEQTGTFSASEYDFLTSWAIPIDSMFSFGANLHFIYSQLENYTSSGMAVDLASSYYNANHGLTATVLVRNLGSQINKYREGEKEDLPFEVQAGISKKLGRAPLRFSLTMRNLQKWDLTYIDPNSAQEVDPLTQEPIDNSASFGDKLLLHTIFGMELLPGKNFHIRAAYNFQRRKELGLESRMSTTGVSWGFGFRVSKFIIGYGRATYHLQGASNHFSLTTNLTELLGKGKNVSLPLSSD